MSEVAQPPLALLEGFAAVWTALAGGAWETLQGESARVVMWTSQAGQRASLPDRMYGLVCERATPTMHGLPAGLAINLPPGVQTRDAELHAVGHQLKASSRESAWGALRRVGRQGVLKARRTGCVVGELDAEAYHRIASLKAERLGGPPPHPGMLAELRNVFGHESVTLTGVMVEDSVAAAVLSVHVDGYGMLIDGSSDSAHWDKNPNNLAVWSAIGALVDAGCGWIDYGFSEPGAGDLRFKDHMGGREVPLYRVTV